MAGNADVSYDDDQQQAVAPKVTETWDAMTGSRKRTSALGAAQQNVFWGRERGPSAVQREPTAMFDKVSQLLELESQSLKDFEAKMHEAMTRFTGTEYENQLKFKSVKADEQVQAIRAEHQTQFSALLHSILSPIEDMTSRADGSSEPLIGPSALDSSNTGATSNTAPATQGAQPEV